MTRKILIFNEEEKYTFLCIHYTKRLHYLLLTILIQRCFFSSSKIYSREVGCN